jgi:3-hydroxy-3-methylglutaryl CoA synthase
MPGIVSYGAYIPYWRLSRAAIATTLGSGGGKGSRSVASYDEDSTSLGVEAARIALRSAPADAVVHDLIFCTTAPAYLDKTNATAIHAALALPTSAGAYDAVGAVRSRA